MNLNMSNLWMEIKLHTTALWFVAKPCILWLFVGLIAGWLTMYFFGHTGANPQERLTPYRQGG